MGESIKSRYNHHTLRSIKAIQTISFVEVVGKESFVDGVT